MSRTWVAGSYCSISLAVLVGCGSMSGSQKALSPGVAMRLGYGRIAHVVIMIQENRSFDNFFAGFPKANAPMYGCGRKMRGLLAPSGLRGDRSCPSGDQSIAMHKVTFEDGPNLPHEFESAIVDWDHGRMDGFDRWGAPKHKTAAYSYIERSEVAPYWDIAKQYVLADEMFPTEFGPSWTAHLTLVAGTDNLTDTRALADFADGKSNCKAAPGTKTTTVDSQRVVRHSSGPFPCLDQFNTMAQELDNAGVSWKYYVNTRLKSFIWSPFAAIQYVHNGADWDNNIITPQTQIFHDVATANLASVSWVTPDKADSDHPAAHSDRGPSWIASVINAIGESPYWNSTAIVVVWDDWGGFYDNAAPPQLDFRGLGVRVPCLIVSPYSPKGYVAHTQFEYGSILKFIEEVFDLPPLGPGSEGYTDTRANSLSEAFDFSQLPRPFTAIPTKYPASSFQHEPPSSDPLDSE